MSRRRSTYREPLVAECGTADASLVLFVLTALAVFVAAVIFARVIAW